MATRGGGLGCTGRREPADRALWHRRELLVPALLGKRRAITEVRPALNGYQKGHCFYCFSTISLTDPSNASDVDHFFPHVLMFARHGRRFGHAMEPRACLHDVQPWSCRKARRLPAERYVQRLHKRNEYLIESNHQLKESLIKMTGADLQAAVGS